MFRRGEVRIARSRYERQPEAREPIVARWLETRGAVEDTGDGIGHRRGMFVRARTIQAQALPKLYPYEAFEPGVVDQDAGTATHQRRPCQFINAAGDRPGLARRYM